MTLEQKLTEILEDHECDVACPIIDKEALARDLAERIEQVGSKVYAAGFTDASRRHDYQTRSALQRTTVAAFIGGDK